MSKRELYFKNYKTGEVSGHVDVTGRSEREIERCMLGMMVNKHDDWLVLDTADDPAVTQHHSGGPQR